jgi:hypothetical protein
VKSLQAFIGTPLPIIPIIAEYFSEAQVYVLLLISADYFANLFWLLICFAQKQQRRLLHALIKPAGLRMWRLRKGAER